MSVFTRARIQRFGPRNWTRKGCLISTNKSILSISAINSAFEQEFMYWTKRVPDDVMQQMIDNSLCFGVYKCNSAESCPENTAAVTAGLLSNTNLAAPITTVSAREAVNKLPNTIGEGNGGLEQIGFARLITDNTTFAYLTDLYILPEHQGSGLGGWLIDCIDEVLNSMPHLRWSMLRTSGERIKELYRERLHMGILEPREDGQGPVMMGRKGDGFIM